ncbi:MAG: response regulator [bacterium]|nr:response regulator [bacterium]
MQAIILQIVGLLLIITLFFLFFLKPNVDNVETKTYSKLIVLNFLFIVIGIFTYIVANTFGNLEFIKILQKVYMCILTLLNMYSVIYCLAVYNKISNYEILKKVIIIITIISMILILILPLNVIFEGDLLDGEGLSYNIAVIHTVFSFIFFLIVLICMLINKNSVTKIMPYVILIILYIAGFLIRGFYKELIFEGFFYSYILLIMYNTIENPDVKMAKELANQKRILEVSSDKTLGMLEDLSVDIKTSIKELEQLSNKKIDNNNVKDLNEKINDIINCSSKLSEHVSSAFDLAIIDGNLNIKEYKYEVNDMVVKLQELLLVDKRCSNNEFSLEASENIPNVVYGDKDNIIKMVIYFCDLISSLVNKERIILNFDSIQIGVFSRFRFKIELSNNIIHKYIYKNPENDELRFQKINDINYEIVNNLLEKFYGKMKVSNNKGKIAITLCVNQRLLTEYEVVSNREENKDIKIKYSDFNGKRILIVDDNKLNIREMKSLLKPYNVEVVVVNSPYEMSKLLNSNVTFDLIFIDDMISSFGINDFTNEIKEIGNNILNYIKKDAKYPITTIIMVTANKGKEEEKYLKNGFSDYIIKPISKGMLDKILRKYFNK